MESDARLAEWWAESQAAATASRAERAKTHRLLRDDESISTTATLPLLPSGAWAAVMDQAESSKDAAILACAFKTAADAAPASKWHTAVRKGGSAAILPPASNTFDVTVPPGEDVQAAVERCPQGGCMLLMPGVHEGPLTLAANKVVHVFGRGQAVLQRAGVVLTSEVQRTVVLRTCNVCWG